ncbi:tRNA (adenosine(37)-N6)-threonylcarbamoyltransferase complex dimerization subunit type 1 TsaB [Erysipelothrix urinaevulpis]|uniref:tRNA (adenosine(37)-N6)-threonylcarbamoyltransferase complex dimerization subunit type 1 TsaB n=1 Tax=Erysipelothrix urinaevulpis TaxID=2683717 RepID=UPI001357926E|nr:tRNA (adenosine(37)-N6)-threonylcarbamoyltransferase complex dimerization subunit type 1 TsaB [Erysipelothrix urinaevulpis]
MLTLIIDTSHKFLAVGLVDGEKINANKQAVVRKQQSEFLIPFINDILTQTQTSKKSIKSIVVTNGPGSYTGMRIALTFVKTLWLTQPDLEVFTVNTLLSLSGSKSGFSMIDARSKRVFGAFVSEGQVMDEKIYQLEDVKEIEGNIFGDIALLDLEESKIDVVQNILDVKSSWQPVEVVDTLVPRYLK